MTKNLFPPCLLLLGLTQAAKADTLHGFCSPACGSNGITLATSTDPLTFGFNASSGPDTGGYFIDFLVPTNNSQQGPITVTGTVAGTATLFKVAP